MDNLFWGELHPAVWKQVLEWPAFADIIVFVKKLNNTHMLPDKMAFVKTGHRMNWQNHARLPGSKIPDFRMGSKANSGNMSALRVVDFKVFLSALAERGGFKHTLRIVVKFLARWSFRNLFESS